MAVNVSEPTEPNFATRITEAEKLFEGEARRAFGVIDHEQGERPRWLYPRVVAGALDHLHTAAAILRDYARRPEGEE